MKYGSYFLLCLILLSVISCDSQKIYYKSPDGYNFNSPEKFNMPDVLHEISGIAFNKGKSDTIYAEQDEEGKLFHFKLGDKKMIVSKFGKPGDFEDVTICKDYVIMLRSDGVLFTFPLNEANNEKANHVQELDNLLPAGEFEGLSSDDTNGLVYVLCKHCSDDKTSKRTSGFIFTLEKDGSLKTSGNFEINVKDIEEKIGDGKINFHPSALAKNPFTKEWFILSSVNKLLVIADADWKVKTVVALNPSVFHQPEGIAFDNNRTLYISNERNSYSHGNILKFVYQKK